MIFNQPLIAHQPSDLTINWAQQVVNLHSKKTTVSGLKILSVDIGTTTRIRIKVDHNSPELLPYHWFIKLPSLNWRARAITALPRLLHTEIRFYNELATQTPVDKPAVLSAKSAFLQGSTLVLNNITEQGALAGTTSDTLTTGQAKLIIEQLANLHATFSGKTNLHKYRWLAGPVRKLEDALGTLLAVPLMKQGLKKAGHIVEPQLHAPAINYARNRRKAMRLLNQGTQTIIHHDCHPGNLFWHKKGSGLLDWQMVRIGEGISDISYFLATSLDPKVRKSNELGLISHYIKSLAKHGISEINQEQLVQRYQAHLVYPFEAMLITLAVGGMMELNANLLLIERAAVAVQENNAFSSLPS